MNSIRKINSFHIFKTTRSYLKAPTTIPSSMFFSNIIHPSITKLSISPLFSRPFSISTSNKNAKPVDSIQSKLFNYSLSQSKNPIVIDPFYKNDTKLIYDKHYVSIAPMLDVSNLYFRQLAHLISPHLLIYSEMISSYVFEYNKDVNYYKKVLCDAKKNDQFVLQLSGNVPEYFRTSTKYLINNNKIKYLNINCGCPSPRSSLYGKFGLYLMREPELVGQIVFSMSEEYNKLYTSEGIDNSEILDKLNTNLNTNLKIEYEEIKSNIDSLLEKKKSNNKLNIKSYKLYKNYKHFSKRLGANILPISVKCRIGIEDNVNVDTFSYEDLKKYIERILIESNYSLNHFIIHLRKGIMNFKFNSSNNLKIPPLNYSVITQLQKDFPDLYFTFNGGVTSIEDTYKILTGNNLINDNFMNNYLKHNKLTFDKLPFKKLNESSIPDSSNDNIDSIQHDSDFKEEIVVNGFKVPEDGFNNKVMIGRYFVDNPYEFIKVNLIQYILDKQKVSKNKENFFTEENILDITKNMPIHPLKNYSKNRIKINTNLYDKYFNNNNDYTLLFSELEDNSTSLPSRFDLLFAYIDSFILYEREFFEFYDKEENFSKLNKSNDDNFHKDEEDSINSHPGRVNMTSFNFKKNHLKLYRDFIFDKNHPVNNIPKELIDFIHINPTNYLPLKPSTVLKPIQNLFHSINFSSIFRKVINDHTNNSSYNTIFHSSSSSTSLKDILNVNLPYVGFEIIYIDAFLQSFGNFIELDENYIKLYQNFKEKYNQIAEEELYKIELKKNKKMKETNLANKNKKKDAKNASSNNLIENFNNKDSNTELNSQVNSSKKKNDFINNFYSIKNVT